MDIIKDNVLRAISDDGAFRVVAVQTTATVQGAIDAQKVTGEVAQLFANLLTGTILVRETMAPTLRVQGVLQAADTKTRMVADSHPDGATRGLVQMPDRTVNTVARGKGGLLQMMRTLFNGSLHQGVVEIPEGGGVAEALMEYMQTSEQVVSKIDIGCVVRDGAVVAAGGYIVQLLPEASQGPLMVMTERLQDLPRVDALLAEGHAQPSELLEEILYAMPHTQVGSSTVRFGCQCSTARVVASLSTLSREDVQSFVDAGKILEIECDYCGKEYPIAPEQLRGLLRKS